MPWFKRRNVAQHAARGDLRAVLKALNRGEQVEFRDDSACTPLFVAAANGHAQVAKALLSAGADVDSKNGKAGLTPLMVAAGFGQAEVMMTLLEARANPNARSELEESVLFVALSFLRAKLIGYPDQLARARFLIADALLKSGTDPRKAAAFGRPILELKNDILDLDNRTRDLIQKYVGLRTEAEIRGA